MVRRLEGGDSFLSLVIFFEMFFQTDNFRSLGIYRCWLIPWTFFPFFFLLRSLGRQPTDTQTHTKRVASLSPPPPPTARHPKRLFRLPIITDTWMVFLHLTHISFYVHLWAGRGETRQKGPRQSTQKPQRRSYRVGGKPTTTNHIHLFSLSFSFFFFRSADTNFPRLNLVLLEHVYK